MASHNITGKKGENLALNYLKSNGFEILELNWKFSHAEIDIIAKDNDILVFIEVKTRSSNKFGKPEEFVTRKKEELMLVASQRYMESIGYEWEIRFDIISVLLLSEEIHYEIKHFKDVFH